MAVLRRTGRMLLKYGFAGVLLAAVFAATGDVAWPTAHKPTWLALAFAAVLVAFALEAVAWKTLLRALDERPSTWSVTRATLAAAFAALFVPTPGPSLVRPAYLSGNRRWDAMLGSTVIDRLNVVMVLAALLLATAPLLWWSGKPPLAGAALAGGALLLAGALSSLALLGRRPLHDFRASWLGKWAAALGGLSEAPLRLVHESLAKARQVLEKPLVYATGLGLQFASVVLAEGAVSAAVALALGLEAPLLVLFLVPTAATALALVPGLPQGLGAVEGAGVLLLGAFGVPASSALPYLLARRAVGYAVSLVVGGCLFFAGGSRILRRARTQLRPAD